MKKYLNSFISTFKLFFLKVIHLGLENTSLHRQHAKITKLTNLIYLLTSIELLVFGCFFASLGAFDFFYINMIWLALHIGCLFLNHLKLFNHSKNIFLFGIHFYLLLITFVLEIKQSATYILIVSSTIPLFIFKSKDYLKIILFFSISIVSFLIIRFSPVHFYYNINHTGFIKDLSEFCAFSIGSLSLIVLIYSRNLISKQNEYILLKEIRHHRKTELALEAAMKTAEKANIAKTEFLSTISHNIRTPLNAIMGLNNLLMIESPKKSQQPKLLILKSSTENLIQLIDNILDFSQIETGKIELHDHDINIKELTDNILNNLSIKGIERNNTITIEIDKHLPHIIIGDDLKLLQILTNLVSNAIKFTDSGNIILEVKVKSIVLDEIYLYFSVSDTGIGIAKEKQKHIFESFTHMNSSISRKYGGSGLGLAIARKLVHLMESEIYVESNLGRGSKFYFSAKFKMPDVSKVFNEESTEVLKVKKDLKGAKVLIVDDNAMNLMVAETFLKRWNAKVDTAEDGLAAVEKARANAYDVILMDIQMPQVNGYDASKEIRVFDPNVAIIALTADSFGVSKNKIEDYGITDFIVKPFQPEELYKKFEKLILLNY